MRAVMGAIPMPDPLRAVKGGDQEGKGRQVVQWGGEKSKLMFDIAYRQLKRFRSEFNVYF